MRKSSRDIADAHPELQKRWKWIVERYKALYPNDPPPQLSQTYRDAIDQNAYAKRGASKVRYPNSTHNIYPSYALDYFFTENGQTSYKTEWVDRVGDLAEQAGLFWGKRWGWDAAHLGLVEYARDATQANVDKLPPLPKTIVSEYPKTIKLFDPLSNREIGLATLASQDKAYIKWVIFKSENGLGDYGKSLLDA